MYARWDRHPVVHAVLFGVLVLAGELSQHLASVNVSLTAFWPPAGLALAAVILLGRGVWPAIALAAFVVKALETGALLPSAAIAIGTTLEAVLGGIMIERFAHGRRAFHTAESVLRASGSIGLFSGTVGATWGVTALTLAGLAHWSDYPTLWTTWWLGHFTGALVVTPFILLWVVEPWSTFRTVKPLEILEAVGLLIGLVVVSSFVFGGLYPSDVKTYPLEFLCGPFFLWAAFRFGRREVATALVILAGIAVWGTIRDYGPFIRGTVDESLVLLQVYLSVTAILSLTVGAVVAERRAAEAQLLELATTDSLTGLVNYRRLMEVLRSESARSDRSGEAFGVLFLDVNGLKAINDRYGHLAGSRSLCDVADAMRLSCRTTDTLSRFGGDEFAIILPETDRDGAHQVLQRIADHLAALDRTPAVSISGGVAIYPEDGATPTALLSYADEALYTLKGRRHGGPVHEHLPEVGHGPEFFSVVPH